MKHLELFEGHNNLILEKKKDKKWISKALKVPGALHKALGIPEDDKIPMSKIEDKIKELEQKSEGDKKLSKKELKLLRRLNLAKTLKEKID